MATPSVDDFEVRHKGVKIPVEAGSTSFERNLQSRGLAQLQWSLNTPPEDNEAALRDGYYFPFDDDLLAERGTTPLNHDGHSETDYGLVTQGTDLVATLRPDGKFDGGVAVEEGTTNLIGDPRALDGSSWGTWNQPTIHPDEVDDPWGNPKADGVSGDADGVLDGPTQTFSIADDSTTRTFSGFVKKANGAKGQLDVRYEGGSTELIGQVSFDLDADPKIMSTSSDVEDSGIEEWPNGWWRVWLVLSNNGTGNTTCRVTPLVDDEGTTSIRLYWTAIQAEESAFSTSFVDGSRSNGRLEYPAGTVPYPKGSVSLWIDQRELGETRPVLFAGDASDGSPSFDIQITSSEKCRVRTFDESGNSTHETFSSVQSGGKHHVVVTWDADNDRLAFYLDSTLIVEDTPWTHTGDWSGFPVRIGENRVATRWMNEVLDDLQTYSTELTQAQIDSLYNGGTGRTRPGMFVDREVNFLRAGDEIELFAAPGTANEKKVYGGVVTRTQETDLNLAPVGHTKRLINYEVGSYEFYADRKRVSAVYENQNADVIVEDIRSNHLDEFGITGTGVNSGPEVRKAAFNYRTASEALDRVGQLTGFFWRVGIDRDLKFFDRSAQGSIATIDESTPNRPYKSIDVTRHLEEYRNQQVVRGGQELTNSRTETPNTDGDSKTFPLSFPVGKKPTVTVNGNSKTVGILGLDTGKDFYWQKGDAKVVQDDGNTTLVASDNLEVTYQGLVPIIAIAQDGQAIDERQQVEGYSGVYEDLETDANIDERDQAIDYANSLLRRHAQVAEEVTMTFNGASPYSTVEPGDLITLDLPAHDLDGEYLVRTVRGNDIGNFGLEVEVTLLSGESVGGWQTFFKQIKDARHDFVIRENEIIWKPVVTFDEAGVSDTLDVSQATQVTPTDEAGASDILSTSTLTVAEYGTTNYGSNDVYG